MFVYIVVAVAVLVAALLATNAFRSHTRRKRNAQKRQENLEENVARLRKLLSNHNPKNPLHYSWDEVAKMSGGTALRTKFQAAREAEQYASSSVAGALKAWQEATEATDKIDQAHLLEDKYTRLCRANQKRFVLEFEITIEDVVEQTKVFVDSQINLWMAQEHTDRASFFKHYGLYLYWKAHHYAWKYLPAAILPEDWSKLVALHIEAPTLHDFGLVPRSSYDTSIPWPTYGELRLRAVRAVEQNSAVDAKIVLAYCDYRDNLRKAVGDRLLSELAKFVVRYHAAHPVS